MTARQQVMEVRTSAPKVGVLLAAICFAIAASVWLVVDDLRGVGIASDRPQLIWMAWFAIGFGGIYGAMLLRRFVNPHEVVLRLDESGVTDRRVSANPIPWGAIRAVHREKFYKEQMIVLEMSQHDLTLLRLTATYRLMDAVRRFRGRANCPASALMGPNRLN